MASAAANRATRAAGGLVGALLIAISGHASQPIEEILVVGERSIAERQGVVGSMDTLAADTVELTRATHVHEALVRIPGVWISRGSGQEHLTAIRSPVFTGTGACGEFLYLENGVPIRPSGFCNINNLFELNTEQAQAIEVVRGPASALYGGNALHGVINVVTPTEPGPWRLALEVGPDDFAQVRVSGGFEGARDSFRIDAFSTTTNGYRDDTGLGEQKLTVTHATSAGDWQVTSTASATLLNQETGGFVIGRNAYRDDNLRRTNPNPESYRDAWSLRAASTWQRAIDEKALSFTPYARRSSMEFLQHFLPGEPLERNGQTSAGVLASIQSGESRVSWRAGTQLEWAVGDLFEDQEAPAEGPPAVVATRPVGVHYDYEVTSFLAAAFYDLRVDLTPSLAVVNSGRIERLAYDYDNLALDGNTREDGTTCGFGGCLYNRPADRDDDFVDAAGRLGLEWWRGDGRLAYATVGTGFRPPQATELYRLQRGQDVADLESERLVSLEIGGRVDAVVDLEIAAFGERTEHFIFRDAAGLNVSDGETTAWGIELGLGWQPSERHAFDLALSYARHEYAFDRLATGGEVIEDGNEVDTAPRWLGSAHWRITPAPRLLTELEIVYQGRYYLDAANTADYDGHVLLNWRASFEVTPRVDTFVRLMNVLDEDVADRADFAFGNHRYFPGLPRQIYAGVEVEL